ncbi:MutS family DNA mismatch repair protein [Leptospira neocaledonica]|uniref:DNA mismatch repair protein n=1 Tax=Leptospira neocaledonica TaxID=2023192 RepID=A0A2N0A1L3_9LEPT|nr:MutS family DNA mismatch repair protein [Leptospira neocaledonica]PJZ78212.1 DNA mismatch repair protein [Leptospira neocaledonica]
MNALNRVRRLGSEISRLGRIIQKEESALSLLSTFRILSFLFFISWIMGVYLVRTLSDLYYLPSILILAVFYRLLSAYQKRREKIRRLNVWSDFLTAQISRIQLDGKHYPKSKREYYKNLVLETGLPSWTKDLDFLGEKGIFSRIDTTVIQKGTSKFLEYFLETPEESKVIARQSAVFGLSRRERVLQKLLRQFRLYEASFPARREGEEEKLPSYIPKIGNLQPERSEKNKIDFPFNLFEEEPNDFWKFSFGNVAGVLRVLFPVWLVLVWVLVLGSFLFGQTWGFGIFILHSAFFGSYRNRSLKMLQPIAEDSETLEELGKLLLYIRSSNLSGTKGEVFLSNWKKKELKNSWKQFLKISNLAAYTQSPLAHAFLNILFFFDLWIWRRYTSWWNKDGASLKASMSDLAELDSLLPLANLSWIEPDFTFPRLEKSNVTIHAKDLVHPLIPSEKRVSNDLEPMQPGKLLLLTGSNMSGKTTYLRALGISGIFAMAGGPVPASEFITPILEVHSSIRNEDSVEEGISFFYAEVRRLGRILQDVKNSAKGRLVLLDEILKGTNSRERTIACKGILKKLRQYGVFGIITTHDLELADLPELSLFHFREEIENGKMTFDYKIRSGIVQSSNALEVLRLEGLDLD